MRQALLFIIAILVFTSCEKKYDQNFYILGFQSSPSNYTLSWIRNEYVERTPPFGYTIYRKTSIDGPETIIGGTEGTTFVDEQVPATPYVAYRVEASNYDGALLSSQVVEYLRPELKVHDVYLLDALYDSISNKLYLFDANGTIIKYDVNSSSVVRQIKGPYKIGYPAMDMHNGQPELYVPTASGEVFVYNTDLDKIDEIPTGAYEACAVATNNGLLYVAVDDNLVYYIRVFDRNSKQKVGERETILKYENMKRFPGTNTELVCLAENNLYHRMHMKFDAGGIFQDAVVETGIATDPHMLEVFPGGTKYVTGAEGGIFNSNQSISGYLPKANYKFTGFTFDIVNNRLLAGADDKVVRILDPLTYTKTLERITTGYPLRMFPDEGQIICVSSTEFPLRYPYTQRTQTIVEKIPLQ